MSHSTVLVVGENPEDQLAPFDENLESPRHVRYTKQQLIEDRRAEIERYKNGLYAEYLKDPEKYQRENNVGHFDYVSKEFPKKLKWSAEQIYEDAIKYEETENIGANGEVYTILNDQAKWDWYALGGRWTGFFIPKAGTVGHLGESGAFGNDRMNAGGVDQIKKGDIDWQAMSEAIRRNRGERYDEESNKSEDQRWMWELEAKKMTRDEYVNRPDDICTFAVLKDGEWYERGDMGWWGIVSDRKDDTAWAEEWHKLVDGLSDDTLLSIYDVHI